MQGATLEEQAKYTNWEDEANTFDKYSREEKENIVEKGIQEAIKGKAGATPANFNRITARKILDNLDNNTKIY